MRDSSLDTPNSDFTHLVRGALARLYDPAYLQNHPLVGMLGLDTEFSEATRAQRLRRLLIECIEALVPESGRRDGVRATRAYAVLAGRYVDGLSLEEIGRELGLSQRQLYREHRQGLEAVASLLWDKVQEEAEYDQAVSSIIQHATTNRLNAVRTELDRLQPSVHVEPLEMEPVLEKVLDLLRPVIKQTGVQVHTRISTPAAGPPVVADRVMLRQTLLNLLSHALHTVQGDLVITLTPGRDRFLIEISESPSTGRTEPSAPSASKPDDVSLMVAQTLIEAQRGHLGVADNSGTWQASVSLPTREEATILIVDDNEDVIALFKRYLALHGVNVVAATNGEQALRFAAELQPDVITLDVMMPKEDGWEILQRLKSGPDVKHIPVIVCSVLNEPELALSAGASDFVVKPVKRVQLLESLRRFLGPLLRPA